VRRGVVFDIAYTDHPKRFVGKQPTPPALPTAARINKLKEDTTTTR
jgi:hypothetical protein